MSFPPCVRPKKMTESNKKSKRNRTALQERVLGAQIFAFQVSLHSFFTPQSSQSDSKSGADSSPSADSSDIPSTDSDTSDTDVTSGSIGSPVQENVVAVNADYVLEPTTQKQTKTQETITTIIDAFALFVL